MMIFSLLLLSAAANAEIPASTLLTPTFQTVQASPEMQKKLEGTYQVGGSTATPVPEGSGTNAVGRGTSVPEAGFNAGSNLSSSGLTSVPQ